MEEQLHKKALTLWVTPNENGGLQDLSSGGLSNPPSQGGEKIHDLPLRAGNPTPSTEVEELRRRTPIENLGLNRGYKKALGRPM